MSCGLDVDYGSAHEIYETELPNFFDGTTFTEAAKVLYAQYHVCLLAVETLVRVTQPTSPRESRASSSEDEYSERKAIVVDDSHTTVVQRILLNPASEHRISAGCRAFIIALNPQLSKAVQQLESVVTVRVVCTLTHPSRNVRRTLFLSSLTTKSTCTHAVCRARSSWKSSRAPSRCSQGCT